MKITIRLAIILAIIGGVLFLGSIILFFWGDFPSFNNLIDTEKLGQLGGLISGLIGSIWALTGVILFYIALTSQREDFQTKIKALETQIKEFELQRVELAETRKVFKEQSETFQQQRFENTFFNMLKAFETIQNHLEESLRVAFFALLKSLFEENSNVDVILMKPKPLLRTFKEVYYEKKLQY
jgi:hypothetical protein